MVPDSPPRTLFYLLPRDTIIATSGKEALLLEANPQSASFSPSTPGIRIVLPARQLHAGEAFTASLSAVNPLPQALTGWTLQFRFDGALLTFVNATVPALWQQPVNTSASVTGTDVLILMTAAAGLQPGHRAQAYSSSSSILLAEVRFVVRAVAPGQYAGAITLAGGSILAPSWMSPPSAFYDHLGGPWNSGSLNVAETSRRGLWAWTDRGDVFNTARFTGVPVKTQLRAALIRSFGTPLALPVPATCALESTARGDGLVAQAATVDASTCVILTTASDVLPARNIAFVLTYGGHRAAVELSLYQPVNATVEAEDPLLNSVLPLNAAPLPPGCSERYQSTRLRAAADWWDGSDDEDGLVTGADVTAFAAFSSNNTAVVQPQGPVAHGIGPGAAAISLAGFLPATQASIVVTDNPACLMAVQAVATTGIEFAMAPLPSGTAVLSWRAVQRLEWEGADAAVLTYASFSDGAVVDVSSRAALTVALRLGGPSPFAVEYSSSTAGLPLVAVNASASSNGPTTVCGPYLEAEWAVCNRVLGSGQGQLMLDLPAPASISQLVALPSSIAPAGDPAALPPLSVPSRAVLELQVAFSDGTTRDFGTDPRTTFLVVTGVSLCVASRSARGEWTVAVNANVTTGAASSCKLVALVNFSGSAPPLAANVTVGITSLRAVLLYAQPAAAPAPPALPLSSPLLSGGVLRLMRCDARNYDQLTLWAAAVLANCSAPPPACHLTDINHRKWIAYASTNTSVFSVGAGPPSVAGAQASAMCFWSGEPPRSALEPKP